MKKLLLNGFYWWLDYAYVAHRQIAGIVRPSDSKKYRRAEASNQTPIILIPGIYENWQFMKPIADVLFKHGYAIHIIEGLGYNRGTVEEMGDIALEYISQHKLRRCVIVAHSKGGLIGKYMMAKDDGSKSISGMVALNTPFSGSVYAYLFILFKTIRIFRPRSKLLAKLMANQGINHRIVSIYGMFDPHIPKGSRLEGARNIQLPVRGHFRIMGSREVQGEMVSAVEELSKR